MQTAYDKRFPCSIQHFIRKVGMIELIEMHMKSFEDQIQQLLTKTC